MISITRSSRHLASAVIVSLWCGVGCTGELRTMGSVEPQDAYVDPANPGVLIVPGKDPIKNPNIPEVEADDPTTWTLTAPYVRRLTQLQYQNTLRLGLGDYLEPSDYPDFVDAMPTIDFANNPNYLTINDANVTNLYDAAQRISARSVTQHAGLSGCVRASDEACFEQLIGELGGKLWRRPLTSAEIKDVNDARRKVAVAGGTRAEQAEFIVQALVLNIHMFYRTEVGDMASRSAGERVALDDYEIAQALSFTLWNEPPDEALLALAASKQLGDEAVYRAQVRRMIRDPRVAGSMTEFFADYLKLDTLFIKDKDASLGLTPAAKRALVSGVREDLNAIFELPGASLLDPFTATNFSVNGASATFFGVEVTSAGFERVALDPTQRYGVLTHPAFLSVHSGKKDSSIIKRGVFTLEQLLCEHLQPAPAMIPSVAPEDLPEGFDPSKITTREALHVQHSSQAACVGCHKQIDPAGFGYENYDSAGRWRTTEKENVAINAAGTLEVQGEVLSFTTSVDYARALRESDALTSCLSYKLMSYVLGEEPSEAEHASFLKEFQTSEANLEVILEEVLMSPSFATRQIKKEQ